MDDSSAVYDDLLHRLAQGDATARDALIEHAQDRLRLRVSQMLRASPACGACMAPAMCSRRSCSI